MLGASLPEFSVADASSIILRQMKRQPIMSAVAASDQAARSALIKAVAEALAKILPEDLSTDDLRKILDALGGMAADLVNGRPVVLRLAPGVAEVQRVAVNAFLERVAEAARTLQEDSQKAAIARLSDARGVLAADNLELRDRFVAETRPLTSAEVGAHAGHEGGNPYATAARWKKAGRVFSVHHRGTEYFPAFQFREGRPHPTVKAALAALPAHLSPWQRAFWFVSTNGWLGGKAPTDLLDDSETVIAAARREGQEVVG